MLVSLPLAQFKTLDLAVAFFDQILLIEGKGHLKDQLQRAASSIALNLSEGNARGSAKDERHFFHVAYGSLRECQTIFRLMKLEEGEAILTADRLGASLYRLVNSDIKDSPSWR